MPKGVIPWGCVWPGALAATLAAGILDFAFPVYLSTTSTLRIGTSAVFVLIALVWFYVLALIVLGGAVINELRFERVRTRPAESAASPEPPATTAPPAAPAPIPAAKVHAGKSDGGAGESVVVGMRLTPPERGRPRHRTGGRTTNVQIPTSGLDPTCRYEH